MVRWVAAGGNTVISDTSVAALIEDEESTTRAKIAEGFASLDADNVFIGSQRVDGFLGLNDTATERQPLRSVYVIDGQNGTLPGTEDVVAHGYNAVATGDYTGITGSNPGYFFGQNLFTTTGQGAADGNGITSMFGSVVEATIRSGASAHLGTVVGFMAEAGFMGAPSGALVDVMMSLRVAKPKRKEGAVAGTATTSYGLYVEGVAAADVGATTAYSMFVQSGTSRFGGPITVDNADVSLGSGKLSARNGAFGPVGMATTGRLTVLADAVGNDVFTARGAAGQLTDLIRAQRTTDGTNWTTVFGVLDTGTVRVNNTATVPAANNGSGGYLYAEGGALKWRGSSGTVTTISPA